MIILSTVISINVDTDKAKASQFLKDNLASFAVIYDEKETIAKHFSIQYISTSMLIYRNGKIKYRHSVFFTDKINQYSTDIKQLVMPNTSNISTKTNRDSYESE